MIVLFIKSDPIRHQLLPEIACPYCSQTGGMGLELHQRYVEFAGGKINPRGVFGVVQCRHCGHTLPASRWTNDLHRAFIALKTGYKTPIAYWKGAIVTSIGFMAGLVLLVGVLGFMGQAQRAELDRQAIITDNAFNHPAPGLTIASIANGQPTYDVWRVSRVSDDAVWLKKYTGSRTLTNFYSETGWATLPDRDFSAEATAYTKAGFTDKGLKRVETVADKNKPYDGVILAVLDK